MILSMKLNKYKKCRLWVNEIGELPYIEAKSTIEKYIPSSTKMSTGITQIAFELSLPKNNSNYALVGFECKPSDNNQNTTKLAVHICEEQLLYSKDTLAMPSDKVFIGISEEYGQSVFDSAVETLNEIGGLQSGEITLNIGAHAECGSSKAIFAQTTRVLMKLSQLDLLCMTEWAIQNEIESIL